jgi:hypothetical protein
MHGYFVVALPGTTRIVQLRMRGSHRHRAVATSPPTAPLPSDDLASRQTRR